MLQSLLAELDLLVDDPASRLRIVPPANLHITLKFLGSVAEEKLGEIDTALKAVASKHEPMELEYEGIGVFKNSIWVGVAANEALHKLAASIDDACGALGYNKEQKPYVPHLTLARFDRNGKIKLSELREKFADKQWGSTQVDTVQLFKSETLPEGARYSVLSSYSLIAK